MTLFSAAWRVPMSIGHGERPLLHPAMTRSLINRLESHCEDIMARDLFVAWLNDAYAMEQSLIPVLENHAADAQKDMPEAAARIRQHIAETRQHAARVEECLKSLGESPSAMKSTLSTVMGTIQSISTGLFRDEPVKNALADYGAEQFEVACYRALVAAALKLGETDIARLCEENMREDLEMAEWLDDQLPTVVEDSLTKEQLGMRGR
jgi:ferritin-like metal-binding protein YciE